MSKRDETGLKRGEGSITQRGDHFHARWHEPQPDGTLRRRGKSFPSLDAAEDHLRTVFRSRRDGRYVSPEERTVADLIEEWLTRGASRWRPWTVATYRQRAEVHIVPVLGDLRAAALTTPRIQHWIDGLTRKGLDPATIDAAVIVLSSALKEAMQLGILRHNPVTGTRRPPVVVKDVATWSEDEVRAFIAQLADEPLWDALYRLAITTGMRPGEIRALTWKDVDLDAGILTVKRTMTRDEEHHVVVGKTTKTGRVRAVALAPSALAALRTWKTAQKKRRLMCEGWQKTDIVFDRGDGQWMPATNWQRAHARFCAKAGVPRITLHGLRHTVATLEMVAGTNPKVVSDRLGHVNIATTLGRYSHVRMDVQQQAANAMDERLFGDPNTTPEAENGDNSGRKRPV
jgi:integrase